MCVCVCVRMGGHVCSRRALNECWYRWGLGHRETAATDAVVRAAIIEAYANTYAVQTGYRQLHMMLKRAGVNCKRYVCAHGFGLAVVMKFKEIFSI